MAASGEGSVQLVEKLKEVVETAGSCQDHGDENENFQLRAAVALAELEEKFKEIQEVQSATTEKNKALEEEIRKLNEKREADKQKYKTLIMGHEKYERMKAEYKEMSRFVKAHKQAVVAVISKEEQREPAPSPSVAPPQSQAPTEQRVQSPPPEKHVEASPAKKTTRGEPCLLLTRSEVCRLEEDVLALRELLALREESWRSAKARETEARRKLAAVTAELGSARKLAQMRRAQADCHAQRLQEAHIELTKYKMEITTLRNNVVRLRNRERSLLVALTRKMKKPTAKSGHKKTRLQRRKRAGHRQIRFATPAAVMTPQQQHGRGDSATKGVLHVHCCSNPHTSPCSASCTRPHSSSVPSPRTISCASPRISPRP